MKKMTRFVLAFVVILACILLTSLAYAHDGETDPNLFKECHDVYWVCRRTLIADVIGDYARCVGQAQEVDLLSQNPLPFAPVPNIIDYYKGIPAHPVEDRQGDLDFCTNEIVACLVNKQIIEANVIQCRDHVVKARARIREIRLVKPKKKGRR